MYIIAQLFGAGAMTSLFLAYQQKKRKNLIISKLSADIFWVAHYLLLGGYGGLIPNLVGIFRELVFVNRRSKKWASCILWPILFICVNWALGVMTFDTLYNLLPITASTFVTVSLWLENPRITKLILIPVSLAFLIYNIFIGSYIAIINESLAIISIIISFIKEHKKETKNNG